MDGMSLTTSRPKQAETMKPGITSACVLAAMFVGLASFGAGAMNKCVDKAGKVTYQDGKCPDDAKQAAFRAPLPAGYSPARTIAAGTEHSLAVKSDGTLWAWGSNKRGQLGIGSNADSLTPVKVGDGTKSQGQGKPVKIGAGF
jgi:hypothetical protein